MKELTFPVLRRKHFMITDAMFRTRARPTHGGIDLTPVVVNQPEVIVAIEDGVIVISDKNTGKGDTSGLDIMLLGKRTGIRWWYGHLSKVLVNVNQSVEAGQILGATGTTGSSATGKASSTGVHLHLEAHYPRINIEIDPWAYLYDAPDIEGSVMPLAPNRTKAQNEYKDYTPTTPTPKDGFLMALTDAQQKDLYDKVMGLDNKIDTVQTWVTATRNEQLIDAQVSKTDRLLRLAEGQSPKVDEVHSYFFGVKPGEKYAFAPHLRNTLNSIHDIVRAIAAKVGVTVK